MVLIQSSGTGTLSQSLGTSSESLLYDSSMVSQVQDNSSVILEDGMSDEVVRPDTSQNTQYESLQDLSSAVGSQTTRSSD